MSTMTIAPLNFAYEADGEVRCSNPKGLIFFLRAEPPVVKPAPEARSWTPVAATQEVEVRRAAEPQPFVEKTRPIPAATAEWKPVEATKEVEVRRVDAVAQAPAAQPAARGTGPLPNVPLPGEKAEKGWFGSLFKK